MPPLDHNRDASRRERTVEHLFVGELLRHAWRTGLSLDVLRPDVDADGYDLVLESGSVIRHVQLKASTNRAKTAHVPVQTALSQKPSGCVVWMICDYDDLTVSSYRVLAGEPGEPLRDLSGFPVVKQSRANAQGVKADRPGLRRVPKGEFETVKTIEELAMRLMG